MKRIVPALLIALFLIQAPTAGAASGWRSTCESLLSMIGISPAVMGNARSYSDSGSNPTAPLAQRATVSASPAADEIDYRTVLAKLPAQLREAIVKSSRMINQFERHIGKAMKPYEIEGALNSLVLQNKLSDAVINKIGGFVYLCGTAQNNGASLGAKLSRWIQSHDEALFVYANLGEFPPHVAEEIFKELREKNLFFSGAFTVPGVSNTFQTFAFEKETGNDEIVALLWRRKEYTDEEWFAIPSQQRTMFLESRGKTVPTALGSIRLGKLEREMLGGWEAKTGTYDILFERTKDSVRQITKALKENHSIHIHQVLALPSNGEWIPQFKVWHKLKADELTIRGLEEGLHPSELIGILPKPSRRAEVSGQKFNTIGLRADIYGDERPGSIKVGLEYRDSTRNLDRLFATIEKNAREIQDGVWMNENFPTPCEFDSRLFYIRGKNEYSDLEPERLETIKKQLVEMSFPAHLVEVFKQDPQSLATLDLALTAFENKSFFDVKKMKYYRPTGTQAHRFQSARANLIEDLKKVAREYAEGTGAGKTYDIEDIQAAIKMCISDWAKAAHVSELFER